MLLQMFSLQKDPWRRLTYSKIQVSKFSDHIFKLDEDVQDSKNWIHEILANDQDKQELIMGMND